MKKCIFICVFNNEKYIEMLYLLLESIYLFGNLSDDIDILIYTSIPFMNIIKNNYLYNSKIKFEINDNCNTIDKACKARLDLFTLRSSNYYDRFLYLDTDIIIKDDLNKFFDIINDDILYVLEEGDLNGEDSYYGGKTLFGDEINNYIDKSAFTSGILLFNNCKRIKDLFRNIYQDIINRPHNFGCYDQPYIVYNAFKYNLFDNKILKLTVINNDNNIHSNKIIHHFPGCAGIYYNKIIHMTNFLNNLKMYYYPTKKILYNIKTPPIKNNSFPLVGICISYNYFDTLKFVLPVNYLHFNKIYLVTQEDDTQTIDFCKKFDNITILFYDFKNNNKKFDKYGAINYAQKIMYNEYPESWYLIFDSDILLPNNFINILIKEKLNEDCIYGAIRSNIIKSSELINKNILNTDWMYNNILNHKDHPPSIVGSFQLYKKHSYQTIKYDNFEGLGDYIFCYENFNLFCNLENIIYIHLGPCSVNWGGKVHDFIDDINIELKNIYYNCNIKSNNIYYNQNCEIINLINNDINNFFKNIINLKIIQLFSYKYYSSKILSDIFSKIYIVDNNEDTNININNNKDVFNIEYITLDIYNNNWHSIPNDIEVSFINTNNDNYRKDIMNSICRFINLQYIIFNYYDINDDIKNVIDKLIENKILIFESFIKLNIQPNTDSIGIICKVNKRINRLINKIFTWGKSTITFLENYKMDAFGDGVYEYTNEYNIIAYFGDKKHNITFNDTFSEFESIRDCDNEVVIGNLINHKIINHEIINKLINKIYIWEDSIITFLDNFKMDAFGRGIYEFINEYNIIAYFGDKKHYITFNDTFSEFKSIRDGDNEVVIGNLINNNIINKIYIWENSTITFLENLKMHAFGPGSYIYKDNYNIVAYFSGINHFIKFNEDYSQFRSIREGNNEIVDGKLI